MQSKNLTISILLPLLFALSLGCADTPTAPTLTEAEINALIDARVAEEIAKINFEAMTQDAIEANNHRAQEIAQTALQSTVLLQVKTEKDSVTATGFFVSDSWIVTCYHIVKGMKTGNVTLILDDEKYPIQAVIAVDGPHDLAIVEAKAFTAPPLPLGDSDTVQIGETVFVVSNPKKIKGTFSVGIASNRSIAHALSTDELLQITAPVSSGSSGGPVLNNDGEVIGVVAGGRDDGQLLNFAIPANHLKSLLETIR